jgi:hypothetical protein
MHQVLVRAQEQVQALAQRWTLLVWVLVQEQAWILEWVQERAQALAPLVQVLAAQALARVTLVVQVAAPALPEAAQVVVQAAQVRARRVAVRVLPVVAPVAVALALRVEQAVVPVHRDLLPAALVQVQVARSLVVAVAVYKLPAIKSATI